MKITGEGQLSWDRVRAAYQQAAGVKGNDRPAKARQEEDTVQLSPDSRFINELKMRLAGEEDIRPARVEAIRARLAAGTYSVPAVDVADAIMKEMGR